MRELSIVAAAEDDPRALCWIGHGQRLTFEQAANASCKLVEELKLDTLAGATAGEIPFAVEGTSSIVQLVALAALLELELPFVVLHPRWSKRQRREVLERCGVRMVLQDSEKGSAVSLVRHGETGGGVRSMSRSGQRSFVPQVVLFTSGTTAQPKGVLLSRESLVAAAAASQDRLGWQAEDRSLLSLPLAHIGGLSVVLRALIARRTVVLGPLGGFDPQRLVKVIRSDAVTLVSLVPTQLQRIVTQNLRCPRCLRLALLGGARTPLPLLEQASSLGWPCITTYGLTEAGSQVATQSPLVAGRAEAGVGAPLLGIDVRITDGDTRGKAKVEGCVEIRGSSLFSGYLGEPPRAPGSWFESGDWGRLDERGHLHVLDRRDQLLISGGENVVPAQIEAVLEAHPLVQACCVVGLEDAEWGHRIAAVVQRRDGMKSAPEDFEQYQRLNLASYQRPRLVRFVARLPETSAGKLDRRACLRLVE